MGAATAAAFAGDAVVLADVAADAAEGFLFTPNLAYNASQGGMVNFTRTLAGGGAAPSWRFWVSN